MPDASAAATTGLQPIAHNLIHPSPLNPRKHFEPERIKELAGSIATHGVLQNLVVRPHPKTKGAFEIVAGESRWRAVALNIKAKAEGFAADYAMPATVRASTDQELIALALTENRERKDLTPLEEGNAFNALFGKGPEHGGMTIGAIAAAAGCSERHVERRRNLANKSHPKVRKALEDGDITVKQAEALALTEQKRQAELLADMYDQASNDSFGERTPGKPAECLSAEHVLNAVREALVEVGRAIFPLDQYKGEIITEGEGKDAERFFGDVGEFERLQRAAVEQLKRDAGKDGETVRELREDYHHGSEAPSLPYGWTKAAKGDKNAVTLIIIAGHWHVAMYPRVRQKRETEAHRAAEPASIGGGQAVPQPEMTNALLAHCRHRKTRALAAVVAGDPDWALRVAILGFMQDAHDSEVVRLRVVTPHTDDNVANPVLLELARRHRAKFPGLLADEPKDGENRWGLPLALDFDGKPQLEKVIPRLAKLRRPELLELFALMAAAGVGSWINYRPKLGDAEAVIALADAMKVDLAKAFTVDAEFLGKCRKPQLYRMVLDLKLAEALYRDSGKPLGDWSAPELRKALLAAPEKLKGYVPTWVRFGTQKELQADLKDHAVAVREMEKKKADKPAAKKAKVSKPRRKAPAAKVTKKQKEARAKDQAKAKTAPKRGAKKAAKKGGRK